MARPKPTPAKQPLVTRSITLTHATRDTLEQLSQDASDALGWTVGGSAVIRAVLRYVAQQPPAWASTTLHPLIEQEIESGVVWGSKKQ